MARKIALFLGLFVAFLPYLGFPDDLDKFLYTIAGLVIAFLAWSGKRPTVASSLEDMEGELHDATHEETPSQHSSVVSSPVATPPPPSSVEALQSENSSPSNTTVAVSFAKQRTRNLKKRITQDGTQSTL